MSDDEERTDAPDKANDVREYNKESNLIVYLYRRPNLFEVNRNLYNQLGVGILENLFTIEDYKAESESIVLFYPERFLNILELRVLVERIFKSGYKEAVIYTCSSYILQTVNSQHISIIDDELIVEGTQFKLSNDESGMPYDGGIGVLGGSIDYKI